MNGISTLAAGRPGWTMEPTGFPPSVGVAAGGGGLALGGGWERCLADLAPGPRNHASPNAAQTEAAMAGALGVQLAGPAWYFGIRVEKPTIGEHQRRLYRDILRSNRRSMGAASFALAF